MMFSVDPQTRDPTDSDLTFVSGVTLDRSSGILWYAVKEYNSDVATIESWNVMEWIPNSAKVEIRV